MSAVHKLWTRIFICAAGLLLLLFFSNDFGLIDIQETAIVVAIGIDSAENGQGYDVTAQIAVPASTGSDSAGNVTVKNAKTVGEAITMLNHETGWYPTLVHCKLILLGEKTADSDVFDALDYFLRNDAVEDSCLVAVCEGTAREIFQAQSPVKDISASAISKVLSSEAQKTGIVSVTILKDFAKKYYSVSQSGFLPVLSVKSEADSQGGENAKTADGRSGDAVAASADGAPQNPAYAAANACGNPFGGTRTFACVPPQKTAEAIGGENLGSCLSPFLKKNKRWHWKRRPLPIAAPAAAQSGQQGQNEDPQSGKSDIFEADKTMLFYQGKRAALLNAEETLAYNLADTDTGFAFGNVTVEEDGQPVVYTLKMKISRKKQKLTFENGMPVFTFDIRANARISDSNRADDIVDITKTLLVDKKILTAAEEKFKEQLASVFAKATAAGCDIFDLRTKLYRRHFKKYEAFRDTILDNVQMRYRIRFTTMK